MKLAYASPLPPERTGVADYSVTLLDALRSECDLQLFGARARDPASGYGTSRDSGAAADDGLPVESYETLRRRLDSSGSAVDLIVYQMGNSPFHEPIRELALEFPGLLVLHEFVLHHLVYGATVGHGSPASYAHEMEYCYGESAGGLARLVVERGYPIDMFAYPLFERLVDRSRAVLVHNEFSRRRVLASRPDATVFVAPTPLPDRVRDVRPDPDCIARFRAGSGVGEDDFLVGVFGLATPIKRIAQILEAFEVLSRELPSARLLIAGDVSPELDLDRLATGSGSRPLVTGHLDDQAFLTAMSAVDVGLNLRHPSAGEASYTLLWLMALGKPVVVSDQGPTAELPDEVALRIPVGPAELDWIVETLLHLERSAEARLAMGSRARDWVVRHHEPSLTTRAYLDACGYCLATPCQPRRSPVLVPPVHTPFSRALASVGSALADLGVATDETSVEVIADRLEELGWPLSR